MSAKAQMQWTLTENESSTTLEAWIEHVICTLSQEEIFTPFLRPDATWGKKTRKSPFRCFTGPDAANRSTILELMLQRIAMCAPAVFYHTNREEFHIPGLDLANHETLLWNKRQH